MANVTRGGGDFGSSLPQMPNIRLAGSRILQIGIVIVVILLLMWSTTSIPTGNVGVLTLFGRVTGETLPEGIHLINPLKSVQKLSVQTQSWIPRCCSVWTRAKQRLCTKPSAIITLRKS